MVAGAARAAPVLDAFIDQELERHGLAEDRLALVGFSQGTMMALHVGPRRSGGACRDRRLFGHAGQRRDPGVAGLRPSRPILLIHGDADPMVPITAFSHTRDALIRHGFIVQTHVSPGLGHSIDGPGLQLGGAS